MNYIDDYNYIKKNDRILVLRPKEGMDPQKNQGMVDKRLFTGENKLHAIYEEESGLWFMRYDSGVLPEQLKGQKFTSFAKLKEYAQNYFDKRNIEITKVED